MSEWIKVEDCLPNECENLLLTYKGKTTVGFMAKDRSGEAVWYRLSNCDEFDEAPTHWMPFPEPPVE